MTERLELLRAEQAIADIRTAYLARTATEWRGLEREFVIELVRGLDEAAFAFAMAPNRAELIQHDLIRHYIRAGAASALRPFLEVLRQDAGGVPWGPTTPEKRALADQHLMNCGRLAMIQRLAALERYGLADITFRSSDNLLIEVAFDAGEEAESEAGAKLASTARQKFAARHRELTMLKPQIAMKLDAYTSVVNGWSIAYDNDDTLVAYHRELARIYATGNAEAEALPSQAMLGGRSFEHWNEGSLFAYGGVLHHIACATRLMAVRPGLELRNLLTVFARKDDIAAVWQERGESATWADRLMRGLTLDAEGAARAERDHEMPLPYYVDFGRDFLLLPMFGGLQNPCAGLVWHVRREYRTDWDKAVGGREATFRRELGDLLGTSRYLVPSNGFKLRRGSHLTDVDAVVLDRATGDLVLVQLKWPDIYGLSLAERNSRRVNLLGANDWVAKVSDWLGDQTAADVAAGFGLRSAAGQQPPVLLVLARYAANFAGESDYDRRARWLSWPRLIEALRANRRAGIVRALGRERARSPKNHVLAIAGLHRLPGLKVEIRCS